MHPLIKAIASIQEAISELETQKDYGSVTKEEAELLNVLKASYHMLARTTLLSILMEAEGMPVFKPSKPDTTEEFIFQIVKGKGEISLRDLLKTLIDNRATGTNKLSMLQIGKDTGISRDNITNFLKGKTSYMTSSNIEKIINYILSTGEPL